jgi:hypothetical protein
VGPAALAGVASISEPITAIAAANTASMREGLRNTFRPSDRRRRMSVDRS